MGRRLTLIFCLSGCGLTLDLDEDPDASGTDAGRADVSVPDAGSRDVPAVDAARPPEDATVVDAVAPDTPSDAMTMRPDTPDVPYVSPCGMLCPESQCRLGECVVMCGGVQCQPGDRCVGNQCIRPCDEAMCPAGQVCGAEGACECRSGPCGAGSYCLPDGTCGTLRCEQDWHCSNSMGSGCTDNSCIDGDCVEQPISLEASCEFCDPRSGVVQSVDADGDGFPPCACGMTPNCDCDDGNRFRHPDGFDLPGLDGDCDGNITAAPRFVCLVDVDMDGYDDVVPYTADCVRAFTADTFLMSTGSVPRLDCDDDETLVNPGQMRYFTDAIPGSSGGCEPQLGSCFDYNCDGTEHREFPRHAQCRRAETSDACAAVTGWDPRDDVPDCGRVGDYVVRCEWTGMNCVLPNDSEERIQACR